VSREVDQDAKREVRAEHVRRVRLGHGANCSSIGSVVDTLFATAAVGAAVLAAVVASLAKEPVKVRAPAQPQGPARPAGPSDGDPQP
jgi:hypothetical protein